MGLKKFLPIPFLVLIIVAIQLATTYTDTSFYLTQLTMAAYYTLVVIGLSLLMGYAGQISLGHAGFFAIGGYISGLMTTFNLAPFKTHRLIVFLNQYHFLVEKQDMYGDILLSFHPWPACITALTVTLLIAFFIGIPVLKLKGHYLAMATLGFGIIIFRLVLALEVLGGADGISEIPGFTILPGITVSGDMSMRVENYYIAWGLLLIGLMLLMNLVNSRVGRALRAIHGVEEAAGSMGINTSRYKLYTFVISAVFASVAGIFLTHYNGGIGPSEAGIMKSVRYVSIVAIGGMASLWGALIMSLVLNFMSLRGMFGSYDDAVFGAILIVIMLFAPHGLLRLFAWQTVKKTWSRLFSKTRSSDGSS